MAKKSFGAAPRPSRPSQTDSPSTNEEPIVDADVSPDGERWTEEMQDDPAEVDPPEDDGRQISRFEQDGPGHDRSVGREDGVAPDSSSSSESVAAPPPSSAPPASPSSRRNLVYAALGAAVIVLVIILVFTIGEENEVVATQDPQPIEDPPVAVVDASPEITTAPEPVVPPTGNPGPSEELDRIWPLLAVVNLMRGAVDNSEPYFLELGIAELIAPDNEVMHDSMVILSAGAATGIQSRETLIENYSQLRTMLSDRVYASEGFFSGVVRGLDYMSAMIGLSQPQPRAGEQILLSANEAVENGDIVEAAIILRDLPEPLLSLSLAWSENVIVHDAVMRGLSEFEARLLEQAFILADEASTAE